MIQVQYQRIFHFNQGRSKRGKLETAILRLCQEPAFRDDVRALRARRPGPELLQVIGEVCDRWHLDPQNKRTNRDLRWLLWLVKTWDPDRTEMPRLDDPKMPLPASLEPIRVTLDGDPPYRATVTLNPGVSPKEAIAAAREAAKLLDSQIAPVHHRPGLMLSEQSHLVQCFAALPANMKPTKAVDRVMRELKARGLTIARSTVAARYREWRAKQGLPVKHHLTKTTDRR